ncbi:MAG: HEAT repeat domain-containing protein [Polyangiales bacterium]
MVAVAMAKRGATGDIDAELAALASGDAKARKKAADALGKRRDAAAVEALIAALDDGDAWVRAKAAAALAAIRDPRAVEPLIARVTPKRSNKELLALVGALGTSRRSAPPRRSAR